MKYYEEIKWHSETIKNFLFLKIKYICFDKTSQSTFVSELNIGMKRENMSGAKVLWMRVNSPDHGPIPDNAIVFIFHVFIRSFEPLSRATQEF